MFNRKQSNVGAVTLEVKDLFKTEEIVSLFNNKRTYYQMYLKLLYLYRLINTGFESSSQ